jgi:hypothetical protein
MRRNNNESRKFWSGNKMFLFGTRVNWAVALLGNILWIHKGFHLARYLLVDYPIGKRRK